MPADTNADVSKQNQTRTGSRPTTTDAPLAQCHSQSRAEPRALRYSLIVPIFRRSKGSGGGQFMAGERAATIESDSPIEAPADTFGSYPDSDVPDLDTPCADVGHRWKHDEEDHLDICDDCGAERAPEDSESESPCSEHGHHWKSAGPQVEECNWCGLERPVGDNI